MHQRIICSLTSFVPMLLSAQITVGTISPPGILCANIQIELPYTANGTYNAGNTFTAELSDASGSFATPTVIGSVSSTASGTITCILPVGLSGNGFQLRVNSSDPPETGVATAGMLMEAPNAGISSNGSSCGGSAYALPFLGGTPDMGGTWSIVSGIGVWAFDDHFIGMADGEVVGYTVTSPGGCSAMATVTFSVTIPANAGTNGMLTLCSNDAAVDMFDYLGGSPDAGGTWAGPSPVIGGMFDPATTSPGTYTYTVQGNAPCPNASAYVAVTVNAAPEAGTDASITVCSSDPPFGMFPMLGGAPDVSGIWTSPGGAIQSGTFSPVVNSPGCYTYTVAGIAPCANAGAALCVTVDQPANAGTSSTVNWCQSFGTMDLLGQLGGNPDAGGTWTDLDATGQLTGSFFDPSGIATGTYMFTYSLGAGSCPVATSSVSVNLSAVCIVSPQGNDPDE